MLNVDKYHNQIAAICREMRIKKLDLFGSATSNRFTPESDIDIIVEFDRFKSEKLFSRYYFLKRALEALFDRKVDIITDNSIKNPDILTSIEESRRSVYAA
ncbi:MAG: DNA polymerase subunit beta [bacterium]|nr:DNA polymerase subunit beta [bacterium]